jgi:hypothetical protein
VTVQIGGQRFLNDEEVWLTIVGPQSPAEFMAFSEPGDTLEASIWTYVAQTMVDDDMRTWLCNGTITLDAVNALTRYAKSYLKAAAGA